MRIRSFNNFCLDMHKKLKYPDMVEAMKLAKDKYPQQFSGGTEGTNMLCEVCEENVLPTGATRAVRPPQRLVDQMTPLLVESTEEALELDQANSGTDPEVTASTISEDEEQQTSFISQQDGQEGEWVYTQSSESESIEVDPQYAHLLDEGFTVDDILTLQQDMEQVINLTMHLDKAAPEA